MIGRKGDGGREGNRESEGGREGRDQVVITKD